MLTMLTLRSVVAALSRIAILTQSSTAHSIKRSPLGYISLIDDPVIHTPSHRLHSHSDFHLTFTLHEGRQKIRLTLSPNHDIIHDDFAISYLTWDGTVRRTEKVLRSEHKVYRGDTFIQRPGLQGWSNAGWARISVYRDGERPVFDGVFRVDGDHHNIQTVDQYLRLRSADDPLVQPSRHGQDAMLVWRDSDIVDTDAGDHRELKRSVHDEQLCASESLSYNTRFDPRTQSSNPLVAMDWGSLLPRQIGSDSPGGSSSISLDNSIGSLDGCPMTRKVALVGIAADCTYWEGFNNMADMRKSIISMVNKASQLYESTFKISLGIQNLTISDKACPAKAAPSAPWNVGCSDRFNISDRLNTFSQWRGQFQDDNAYWTLLTRCNTNSAVGLAWRGQLCATGVENNGESGEKVASANVVVGTDTEWQIFAHETGHTFGAFHDCTQATCGGEEKCCPLSRSSCDASGKFIMNPTTGKGITQFSPCSIGNICSGLKSSLVKGSCLTDNRNIKTITGSQCGNGIVESGEDCDCGGDQSCQGNRCCEPKTCKFTAGSVCDPANEDCCTPECKFAGLDKVCRASTGVCDPEETCSGDAAGCPGDKHKNDGDACGDGLSCASGQCTSRDQQCKVVTSNLRGISSTRACPGSSCRVSCMSSDLGPNECVMLSQNFVDGTSCGGGGKCINGSCQGASTIKEIGQWINDNKSMLVPVVSVVGGLIVLAILISIISRIRRRIRRRKLISEAKTSSWPSSHNGYDANRPPPPPPHHWQQQRQWGDVPGRSDRYNAQGHHQQPHYTPGVQPFSQHSSNQWSERHRSMRYA